MESFIKWVGGKKRLFLDIKKYAPKKFNKYIEPFLGGGYVFLNMDFEKAIINDGNQKLINVYLQIKYNWQQLITELKKMENKKIDFYKIRDEEKLKSFQKKSDAYKAARFIYLNKHCFNGMYRENSKGYFNVPKGRYSKINLYNEKNFEMIHKKLNNNVEIISNDFYTTLDRIEKNDFVYLDPPYDPIDKTKSFTTYLKDNFDKQDQIKLKEYCDEVNKKGAFFMQSNNATDFIKELYKDYNQIIVSCTRVVGAKSSSRVKTDELLITNYLNNEI